MKIKILKSNNKSTWYNRYLNNQIIDVYYDIRLPKRCFTGKNGNHGLFNDDVVITELPESFCVKSCDDGIKWGKYIQWLNKTYNTDLCGRLFNFDNPSDRPYYGVINDEGWGVKLPFGTEIHIDDMIKHIDYMESQQHINGGEQFSKESQLTVNMEKQKLSRQGLKEIHSVACSSWKLALETSGLRNPLEDYVELTQEEVDKMFRACTKEQLPIVSKYLKQDDGSVDLSKIACEVYLDSQLAMIEIRNRYEYCDKAFWLNDVYFNWEIKKDSNDNLCLIPTKKK